MTDGLESEEGYTTNDLGSLSMARYRSYLHILCLIGVLFLTAGLPSASAEILFAPVFLGPEVIFSDSFESGDVSAWSNSVGFLFPPTAFRFSDLDLRDPHVFVEPLPFICLDFTDTEVGGTSFNGSLQTLITEDGDGDGLLDLNLLLLFRPLDPSGVGLQLDLAGGLCSSPLAMTTCDPDPQTAPVPLVYDSQSTDFCLETLPGTTSDYVPGIDEPVAPCFVTLAETLVVDLLGIPVALQDAQVAATYVGDPVLLLQQGMLRGFLSASDADSILLPPDLPLVGGQPLSVLLPGGTGSCASGDGVIDQHLGEDGWWFYFNYTADEVPYSGS